MEKNEGLRIYVNFKSTKNWVLKLQIANYYICGSSANLTNLESPSFDLRFAELICGRPIFASLLLILRFKIGLSETVTLFSNPAKCLFSKLYDEPVNYSDTASFPIFTFVTFLLS